VRVYEATFVIVSAKWTSDAFATEGLPLLSGPVRAGLAPLEVENKPKSVVISHKQATPKPT